MLLGLQLGFQSLKLPDLVKILSFRPRSLSSLEQLRKRHGLQLGFQCLQFGVAALRVEQYNPERLVVRQGYCVPFEVAP